MSPKPTEIASAGGKGGRRGGIASFSALRTLDRPISSSGNVWNHRMYAVEFLEAYQLDSGRYIGNVRPIPSSIKETGRIGRGA